MCFNVSLSKNEFSALELMNLAINWSFSLSQLPRCFLIYLFIFSEPFKLQADKLSL